MQANTRNVWRERGEGRGGWGHTRLCWVVCCPSRRRPEAGEFQDEDILTDIRLVLKHRILSSARGRLDWPSKFGVELHVISEMKKVICKRRKCPLSGRRSLSTRAGPCLPGILIVKGHYLSAGKRPLPCRMTGPWPATGSGQQHCCGSVPRWLSERPGDGPCGRFRDTS